MTIRTFLAYFWLTSIAILCVACSTNIPRGHLKEDERLATIKVGVTSKDEILKGLGSPSTESSFGPTIWYYISGIKQNHSLLPSEVIEQHVIEIAFDPAGIVSSMKEYTLADGKNIEFATKMTPTEGQRLGFFEQIISNLGKYNKDSDSISNSHTHGSGGVPTGLPSGR